MARFQPELDLLQKTELAMKSLKELGKIKIAPKKKDKPEALVQEGEEPQKNAPEQDMFLRAMEGVRPLNHRGRNVVQETQWQQNPDLVDEFDGVEILHQLVNGHIGFDLEHSDEYIQGYVKGINSKTLGRLKKGSLSIQAHLDLHGLNALQARLRLTNFIREQYLNSRKCLLIVHGRGKNSDLGAPVLRNEIQTWLIREPLKRVVLAFCSAQPRHGGTGALYVLIRNYRKSGGKILWEKYLVDIEDY